MRAKLVVVSAQSDDREHVFVELGESLRDSQLMIRRALAIPEHASFDLLHSPANGGPPVLITPSTWPAFVKLLPTPQYDAFSHLLVRIHPHGRTKYLSTPIHVTVIAETGDHSVVMRRVAVCPRQRCKVFLEAVRRTLPQAPMHNAMPFFGATMLDPEEAIDTCGISHGDTVVVAFAPPPPTDAPGSAPAIAAAKAAQLAAAATALLSTATPARSGAAADRRSWPASVAPSLGREGCASPSPVAVPPDAKTVEPPAPLEDEFGPLPVLPPRRHSARPLRGPRARAQRPCTAHGDRQVASPV